MNATKKKKSSKSKTPSVARLPDKGVKAKPTILPRGQARLPNGEIRLKCGAHKLGRKVAEYVVCGLKIKLSGDVLVANKNVDWLSIGKCQKCGKPRPDGVNIHNYDDGEVILTYACSNKKECDLGGLTYVQVHEKGRFNNG